MWCGDLVDGIDGAQLSYGPSNGFALLRMTSFFVGIVLTVISSWPSFHGDLFDGVAGYASLTLRRRTNASAPYTSQFLA